ncbi:uncharacterized protein LOC133314926 isoform X1 [Gastrolobium bilobum]|uniref:uncharacterized protein LOC133314926 isoform X1 n=1 Tax=Gastrolobium bilobum TaxID=150636 RepID=UPI002AAFFA62|nr:uncharacterized protein LOC133314926 isoform X1 [Gastrolobium bilobum]
MDVTLSISPQRPKCSNSSPSSLVSSSNPRPRPAVILPGTIPVITTSWRKRLTISTGFPPWSLRYQGLIGSGMPLVCSTPITGVALFNQALSSIVTVCFFFTRYLKRVHDAVQEANELAQGATLSLIGHSAGGWLARVYMEEFGLSHISLLLTLGTPHLPPPKGVPGVIDQTRGLLDYVEKYCSKAVYTPQLKYVCIAGRYIEGARLFGKSNPNIEVVVPTNSSQPVPEAAIMNTASTSPPNATLRARFVGQGYKQVCGQADVWGDGVVPEVSAHLEGALNICLDGVYHSPVGSDDAMRPWYGSPDVLEQWIEYLLN